MKIEDIKIGGTYTYYPPKHLVSDNEHYPSKVLGFTRRKKVQIETPVGKKTVPYYRLEPQLDLL